MCNGDKCPEGLSVCCQDCIRKELNACKGRCENVQEICRDYIDETRERKRRKLEREKDRRMALWATGLLIAVLLMFVFALWQTWENQKWIEKSQKMRSGQLTTQQPASLIAL